LIVKAAVPLFETTDGLVPKPDEIVGVVTDASRFGARIEVVNWTEVNLPDPATVVPIGPGLLKATPKPPKICQKVPSNWTMYSPPLAIWLAMGAARPPATVVYRKAAAVAPFTARVAAAPKATSVLRITVDPAAGVKVGVVAQAIAVPVSAAPGQFKIALTALAVAWIGCALPFVPSRKADAGTVVPLILAVVVAHAPADEVVSPVSAGIAPHGNPVAFVSVSAEGVPSAGLVSVGDVART
jgi:hypothetical protein